MEFSHVSVLLKETVDGAFTGPKGVYADLTTGGGGHSLELAKRLDGGRLICFDQDKEALEAAGERLKGLPVTLVRSNFCEMKSVLADLGIRTGRHNRRSGRVLSSARYCGAGILVPQRRTA